MMALLAWQWQGYARYHQNRTNLLLHVVAVPLFLAGSVLVVLGAIRMSLLLIVLGIVAMGVSVALQGRGHRLEAVPPEPFTGPTNAVGRLFFEQCATFPRFVISGGWRRNFSGR
jgi:2-hydroxy-palmitic acid dioxygenase Mpo1-like protein